MRSTHGVLGGGCDPTPLIFMDCRDEDLSAMKSGDKGSFEGEVWGGY